MNCMQKLAVALVLSPLAALAAPVSAIQGVAGGSPATSGTDQLYGWEFSTSGTLSVSSLGAYDYLQDGMAVAHDIGIFRASDHSLVASGTLGAGLAGSLVGDFRYFSLGSTVSLVAGTYVIVMTMPVGNGDYQLIDATSVTTAPQVTYLDSAFDAGSSLAFPTSFGAFAPGMFGPNFIFDAAAATVPEPAGWALVVTALTAAGLVRRKKTAR